VREPARRYIVLIQAPGGYPAPTEPRGPAPEPPHPTLHTGVLATDYESLEAELAEAHAEIARLRARLGA